MKKYMILFSVTITLLIILGGVDNKVRSVPMVSVVRIVQTEEEIVVHASGKIEEANVADITSQIPLAAKNVYVKVGDNIRKGEILARIDPEKTAELLNDLYGGTLSALPAADIWSESLITAIMSNRELIPRTITSPVNGTVSQVHLSKNKLSTVGMPLVSVSTGGERFVRVQIKESEIAAIKVGQTVRLTGESFSKSYNGVVKQIADTAVQTVGGEAAVEVTIFAKNADADFRPGMTAAAEIIVDTLHKAVLVPYEAVRIDENCLAYVLCYQDHVATKRVITIDQDTVDGYIVREGLREGELILKNGTDAEAGAYVCISSIEKDREGKA